MALKTQLTRQDLLDKIGDQNIFIQYFGEFVLGKSYPSIFRQDDKFSTGFYVSEHGHIIYNDFATGEKLDCVAFVAKKYKIGYYKAVDLIAADFGLIKGKGTVYMPIPIITRKSLVKAEKLIQIEACKFTDKHLAWWAKRHITEEELKAENIYAVCSMAINGWVVPRKENELSFGYLLTDENGKQYLKIYTPDSQEFKWVSSSPLDLMFGLDKLPYNSDILFIGKAQKERLHVKKILTDVVALQAENKGALNIETLKKLKDKYKRIIYFGDNDAPGIKFCDYVADLGEGIETFHFPEEFLTKFKVKDIDDFVSLWGIELLKKYFTKIGIING